MTNDFKSSSLFFPATAKSGPAVMVIAEIGVNHDGQTATAIELTQAAAKAGADAIKLQCFKPSRLLSNQAMLASYQQGQATDAATLLEGLALSLDDMARVRDEAHKHGLAFIVTPFSLEDLADLEALGVDMVKIASPDAVNTPLLGAASSLGKPMLVSTGTCELDELDAAAGVVSTTGGALLQCVSSYPTPLEQASLGGIAALATHFDLPVGYSDHTPSLDTGGWAVAAGACVIEKHLTHDRGAPGPDHAASLEPSQLAEYITHLRHAQSALGPITKHRQPIEQDVAAVSRQSVCAARDLPSGHTLTHGDLTVRRPGTGIPAREMEQIPGCVLSKPLSAGDLLTRDALVP